mgnify:CR=1 FL=1
MSYFTLKNELTGSTDLRSGFDDALTATYSERSKLQRLKQGIVDVIFIPAIDVMSNYIKARQDYLNANNVTSIPSHYRLDDGSIPTGNMNEWHSPLTHEWTGSSLTTTLCSNPSYGLYTAAAGTLSAWRIEKWNRFRQDDVSGLDPSTIVACASCYGNSYESYTDISHTRLAQVTGAPYNLDPVKHSLSNLTAAVTSFDTGMNWIFATTTMQTNDGDNPAIDNTNRFASPYSAWGINDQLDGLETSISSIKSLINFQTSLQSLNSQY